MLSRKLLHFRQYEFHPWMGRYVVLVKINIKSPEVGLHIKKIYEVCTERERRPHTGDCQVSWRGEGTRVVIIPLGRLNFPRWTTSVMTLIKLSSMTKIFRDLFLDILVNQSSM